MSKWKPYVVRFDQANEKKPQLKDDFMDYESEGITPQRFGDTRPQVAQETPDYEVLHDLYHRNGVAYKVVRKPAEDATRNGWRIVIPSDVDLQNQMQAALATLELKQRAADELSYMRLDGDAYMTIGTDDANENAKSDDPIDVNNLNNVVFVHSFGAEHVNKVTTNNDPTSDNFQQEDKLVVNQTESGQDYDDQGNPILQMPKIVPIVIDKSRYFHISLDKLEDDITGNSILVRCFDAIKTLDTALYSAGKILYAYDINVITDQDYSNADESTSADAAKKEDDAVKQGMGTDNVLMLHDGQKFERFSTSVSGIDSLLTFAWQNLAAASNIPKSVLLGEQSGTLAGASQDVANYYDSVKAMQEEILRPQLEYIIKLLFWSSDVAGGSVNPDNVPWKLEFNPLWSQDDKTNSETFLNTANAITTLQTKGTIDDDEARNMLVGQNNNGISLMQTDEPANGKTKTDAAEKQAIKKAHDKEKLLKDDIHGKSSKDS